MKDVATGEDQVGAASQANPAQRARLGFFRGARFDRSLGGTSWRVGLYLPEQGFETYVFGIGNFSCPTAGEATLISMPDIRVPYAGAVVKALYCAWRARPLDLDVVVCNIGLALAGYMHKILSPRSRIVLDVRSTPVEGRGLRGLVSRVHFWLAIRTGFFDAVTTISDGMLLELRNDYGLRSSIPCGVWSSGYDDALFTPGVDGLQMRAKLGFTRELVILYHGSFSPNRGLDKAVESIRSLRDRGIEDARLLLVGEGEFRRKLEGMIEALGIGDLVTLAPAINHEDVPSLIAASDLGIDPLPDHPWWRNQSSLKVLEFLAMGKPVIATPIPSHWGISEAVILAKGSDPSSLASAIEQYRSLAPAEKERLQRLAIRDAAPHSWREKARTLADFIRTEVLR